jgi:hypothetical protein
MSAAEVAFRLARSCRNQAERLIQSTSRWPDLEVPEPSAGSGVKAPNVNPEQYLAAAEEILGGNLTFFTIASGEYGEIPPWNKEPISGRLAPLNFGKTLDYRDERLVGDIKYLWEPNRHYHLVALGQAYALSGDTRYLARIASHLKSWIEQCPYGLGPNWCSSLELGIRLINWWLVWQLIGGLKSPVFDGDSGRQFRDLWLRSIYQHVTFIRSYYSRYSSANNHLIGESAAVVIATSVWPYWEDFAVAGSEARNILAKECLEQNHDDGVNKEQAIWYQQFVLDFLILAGTCTRDAPGLFPHAYWDRIEAMLEFVAAMRDRDGHMPMFGDADDGVVCKLEPSPEQCPFESLLHKGAFLFNRSDFRPSGNATNDVETNWLTAISDGFRPIHRPHIKRRPIPTDFPSGGYYTIGSDPGSEPRVRMVVKAGPLGYGLIAAHGHADALSIYLTIGGKEILIDPGTFAYHTAPKWRNYFRGTSAHNTVRLDGLNQSSIGGNFLWTEHANTECELISRSPDVDEFVARHDGYSMLPDPVCHRRKIRHSKIDRQYVITDELIGSGVHGVEIFFHLAENCLVSENEDAWQVESGNAIARFTFDSELDSVSVYKGDSDLPLGWISRSFGSKLASPTIVCQKSTALPATFVTQICY